MGANDNRVLLGCAILFQIIVTHTSQAADIPIIDAENVYLALRNAVDPPKLKISLLVNSRSSSSTLQLSLPARSKHVSLLSKRINLEKPLVFLIHGFLSNGQEKWLRRLAKAYLARKDVNIFTVDWSTGALSANYYAAVERAHAVGIELSSFIKLLIKEAKVEASQIHIIGHSLGAQIAGFVGKHIVGIHRITGLDPARPEFSSDSPRLSSTDAKHVDVIHTSDSFGTFDRIGHLDFYMNGGAVQPACKNTTKNKHLVDRFLNSVCSHGRAVEYFIESIKNPECLFVASETMRTAKKVRSKDFDEDRDTVLGLDAFKYKSQGVFYVTTNPASQYCIE